MRVPWMSVVRKAMMPMKKKDSVRYRLSEIFSSSSTKRDSDSPTAPLSPDLRSKAHNSRNTSESALLGSRSDSKHTWGVIALHIRRASFHAWLVPDRPDKHSCAKSHEVLLCNLKICRRPSCSKIACLSRWHLSVSS